MTMIYGFLSLLGLVLLTGSGSLVNARRSIGIYAETKPYYDYSHAFDAAPVLGWSSSDWDAAERTYVPQEEGLLSDSTYEIPQDGVVADGPASNLADLQKCTSPDGAVASASGKHHGHKKCKPGTAPTPSPSDAAPILPPSSDNTTPPQVLPSPVATPPSPTPASNTSPSQGASPDTTGNPVDDCWRHDPNWAFNRQRLALCAVGFGQGAKGGADGPIYVVTDESDDDLVNPKEGTLRYAVLQDGPLWIGFARDMTIKLTNELLVTSFKTIDGRGFDIHIAGGGGLTLQYVSNVIIHGLHIHDTQFTAAAVIRSNSSHSGHRSGSDGDAVSIFGSHDVWVDRCYFARGSDGLVDGIMGSTRISVTNNYFEQHDKVMLFGAHPFDDMDGGMQVSVAFNHFAEGLIERTPRVRHGLAHVFNNYYVGWGQYAIGGSEAPTILSEANVFNAPNSRDKQVTKRIDDGDASFKDCKNWNWQSVGDKFLNGAYFVAGGAAPETIVYSKAVSTTNVVPADLVERITSAAGPLRCSPSGGTC